ncbi:MAG: hypothetical protein ABDH21_03575 [bacterium]
MSSEDKFTYLYIALFSIVFGIIGFLVGSLFNFFPGSNFIMLVLGLFVGLVIGFLISFIVKIRKEIKQKDKYKI